MKPFSIYRIGDDLKMVDVTFYPTLEEACYHINHVADVCGWKFIEDNTVVGGYYVSRAGTCYGVR